MRVIPVKVLNFEELLLPASVEQICQETGGLIACTGMTGSGKSTTLAAMIEYINSTRTAHVVTIEDPIEFLHRDKKALINQREVEVDTRSFATALKSALRQDPDVIHVGELPDVETIEVALTAAETGHLVMTTLHTMDATDTVGRIISVFPPAQQKQVRLQLASALKAVISLRLLPRKDGRGRVPAIEILRSTPYIRECIENAEKTRLLPDAIAAGQQHGMQTFDQSIFQLHRRGMISKEEALRRAAHPDELKLRLAAPPAADVEALPGPTPAGAAPPPPLDDSDLDLGSNY
jgi:twitching motility protein PilT